ncbi:MAG: Mg-dependent DNase [Candidatus Curtissbacteria bacterium GW2011_GWA1_40_9]|uniref:Mg-dependent DNase n=1 Tax=Candidatus Curtissbacteria bacterium GW2011_GWA1_40_9 TaxID=1618408 RepID=A0A0G0TMI0_9BACT|nr:MAG: Mg-dependent DNase [Candidatus Curtissbacteria bacterium GW2011_GWA1_40_9]
MSLVDSHAHLEAVENLEEVLEHAKAAGVGSIVSIGTSLNTSRRAIDIAEKYSSDDLRIFATVGMHPFDSKGEIEDKGVEACMRELTDLASTSKKIVGIGEAGLDYYGQGDMRSPTGDTEKEFQKKLFCAQVKIANDNILPIVVHCRNGWDEIFQLLSKDSGQPPMLRGVFHSFTGGYNEAKKAVGLGFYISFSGIVTFENAVNIQEAARIVPGELILLETDSPFLSPEPFRGQKNEPTNVKIIASFLAKLRNIQESDFCTQTTKNAQKAFKL